jgi:hypothetical protein
MLLPALALAALAVPSSAFGQATRTWVSGVGDDANPCSRTAPCKTFAGAISKTAAKGEINVIDPGGFGALTITKSITVKAEGPTAGVLTNAANAININAGANDKVTLSGLDINGLGTANHGIRITAAKTVVIKNNDIYEFARNGISVETSTPNSRVLVKNNHIHDNAGVGVMNAPLTAGSNSRVNVRRNEIEDNTCGIVATEFGVDPAFNYLADCGTASSASGVASRAVVDAFNNSLSHNFDSAAFARGGTTPALQAIVRLGGNEISQNANNWRAVQSGAIISFQNNMVDGNANPANPPTSTVGVSKRGR